MPHSKTIGITMDSSVDLHVVEEPLSDDSYVWVIGCLFYLSVETRPHISYAVAKLAKFSEKPSGTHWKAVKRIPRHINETRNLGLAYGTLTATGLHGFVDSDWEGNINDRKSTSGDIFVMCGGAVSWSLRKQEVVALSNIDAEYVSLCSGTMESIWLYRLWSGTRNGFGLHVKDSVRPMVELLQRMWITKVALILLVIKL